MELGIASLAGLMVAALLPLLGRIHDHLATAAAILVPTVLFAYFFSCIDTIAQQGPIVAHWEWIPALKFAISFRLDGLSLLFSLLITGIGTLIFAYTRAYLDDAPTRRRFYVNMLLFMSAMEGAVLANNLFLFFVFWELTSLTSYLLIGFFYERETTRESALQALLVTGAGGLILLAAILLLGQAGGGVEMSTLIDNKPSLLSHRLSPLVASLMLLAAFTKSAQFPFHFWLPDAMAAPTPASAYLHAATMVKLGIYLVMRLLPLWQEDPLWQALLMGVGGTTMLVGAAAAMVQSDLKRILAYATVSVLGMIVFLLGIGTALAVTAAIVVLFSHSLYKAALFLSVGAIDHALSERHVERLAGLAGHMPMLAAAAALAALSMIGSPPFIGFVGKELFVEASLTMPQFFFLAALVTVAAIWLLLPSALLIAWKPFYGSNHHLSHPLQSVSSPRFWLMAPPLFLSVLGLAIGLNPATIGHHLLLPAVHAVQPMAEPMTLSLWHGWNRPLVLSMGATLSGLLLYRLRPTLLHVTQTLTPLLRFGPKHHYQAALVGFLRYAQTVTRFIQSGYLRRYLLIVIASTIGLVSYTILSRAVLPDISRWEGIELQEAIIAGMILLSAWAAALSRSRLASIAAVGSVGYGVALLFSLFGAPDLAMIQFIIETLMVIVFVLIVYRLPAYKVLSPKLNWFRDMTIALAGGAMMTMLVLLAVATPAVPTLSEFFIRESLPQGWGHNVVNVMLVDFRALDTLGEVTVLTIAGVGVYALLKLRLEKRRLK